MIYLCRKLLHGLHELLEGHRAGPVLVEDAEGSLLEELLHYKDGRSYKDFRMGDYVAGVTEGECEDLERKLVIEKRYYCIYYEQHKKVHITYLCT